MAELFITTSDEAFWHRRESRVVRPFPTADHYLQDAAVRWSTEGEFNANEFVELGEFKVWNGPPVVRLPAPPDNFAELVIVPTSCLLLVVVLEVGFLKRSKVLVCLPLDTFQQEAELVLDGITQSSFPRKSDFKLHIAVVLAKDLNHEAGVASRKGNWLARKTFHVGKEPNYPLFTLHEADEDWFARRSLPKQTAYYIEVDGSIDQPAEDGFSLVGVHVSQNLLHALARNQAAAANQALMKMIFVDVITTMLIEGAKDTSGVPLEGGVLSTMISRLAATTGSSGEYLLELARAGRSGELRTWIQKAADLTHSLVSAAKR